MEITGEFAEAFLLLRAPDGSLVRLRVAGHLDTSLQIEETIKGDRPPFVAVGHVVTLRIVTEDEIDANIDRLTPDYPLRPALGDQLARTARDVALGGQHASAG